MAAERQVITVAAGQITARLMNEAADTLVSLECIIAQSAAKGVDLLVLPECAYPAYLLGSVTSYRSGDHLSGEEFVGWLSRQAARYRMHIISGFVDDAAEEMYNAAVFIDDRGEQIGRSRKRFLWHVDHDWFIPGREIQVFDSAIGRVGMIICAETRAPEMVATLVADGSGLLAMPTCWVNTSTEPGQFRNPQIEFLIAARAREFGVPFVCADKTGIELGSVGYVGRSRIVDSEGSLLAEASAAGEEVITARLQLQKPQPILISDEQRAMLLSDRMPVRSQADPHRLVTLAAVPTQVVDEHLTDGKGNLWLGSLRDQGVGLLMAEVRDESRAGRLVELSRAFGIHAIGWLERSDVFALGSASIGCVAGREICSFAASRILALSGVELLLFFDMPEDLAILRTRAAENCVFVAGANECQAVIMDPKGEVLAQTRPDRPAEAVAQFDLSASANKFVAPKTDIFDERHVELYRF
ncbi:MAG: hypothetical protein JSV03_08965 [Planctomycetota bacterium]|nr:MAG: hypothetical protein JSV03_08965 [Planctomycetota bacterium]